MHKEHKREHNFDGIALNNSKKGIAEQLYAVFFSDKTYLKDWGRRKRRKQSSTVSLRP
jgi:hypothetical protein